MDNDQTTAESGADSGFIRGSRQTSWKAVLRLRQDQFQDSSPDNAAEQNTANVETAARSAESARTKGLNHGAASDQTQASARLAAIPLMLGEGQPGIEQDVGALVKIWLQGTQAVQAWRGEQQRNEMLQATEAPGGPQDRTAVLGSDNTGPLSPGLLGPGCGTLGKALDPVSQSQLGRDDTAVAKFWERVEPQHRPYRTLVIS